VPDKLNKAPGSGGSYDNDDNALASGGETTPVEATDATGKFMSYEQVSADAQHEGESRQADEDEMRGANAPSS
jgi:hypothetical protein